MSLADQPAFPVPVGKCPPGMTYRQWLVGMALQGLLANQSTADTFKKIPAGQDAQFIDKIATASLALADAAVRAQEK